MESNCREGMLLKLDISKAYNMVSWPFLSSVLIKFDFGGKFLKSIKACFKNLSYSMLVNGAPQGLFSSASDLKHGDPLPPYLFILMADVLGHNINNYVL